MIEDILLKGHASFHMIRSYFRAQKSDYVKSSFPVYTQNNHFVKQPWHNV